jgi:hypothetical protein
MVAQLSFLPSTIDIDRLVTVAVGNVVAVNGYRQCLLQTVLAENSSSLNRVVKCYFVFWLH